MDDREAQYRIAKANYDTAFRNWQSIHALYEIAEEQRMITWTKLTEASNVLPKEIGDKLAIEQFGPPPEKKVVSA